MMPSGGGSPLNDADWQFVLRTYNDAVQHGLHGEWLRWFIGGLVNDKMSVTEAAVAAALEWDF